MPGADPLTVEGVIASQSHIAEGHLQRTMLSAEDGAIPRRTLQGAVAEKPVAPPIPIGGATDRPGSGGEVTPQCLDLIGLEKVDDAERQLFYAADHDHTARFLSCSYNGVPRWRRRPRLH